MSAEPIPAQPILAREAPWNAGLRALRANILPGAAVQAIMLSLVLLYYFNPSARAALDELAVLKQRWGYAFSGLAAVVAGGLIPEILRVVFFQKGRVAPRNARNLVFTVPFWGTMGVLADLLYRMQGAWFGDAPSPQTVILKVMVDQFLYNPLFAAPVTVWLYEWNYRKYRADGIGDLFTAAYYRDAIVPTLFATWGVWIPMMSILYSLPGDLQIPMFALALSMWVTLYTWMSEHR